MSLKSLILVNFIVLLYFINESTAQNSFLNNFISNNQKPHLSSSSTTTATGLPPNKVNTAPKDHETQTGTTIIERFNHRYPDGSYEYRYELSDGTARYERGYFLTINKVKTLVVVGYYSYRMDNGNYLTVFYNADQNGFRQNQSITPKVYPNLPRSIEIPEFDETVVEKTQSTQNTSSTQRSPQTQSTQRYTQTSTTKRVY